MLVPRPRFGLQTWDELFRDPFFRREETMKTDVKEVDGRYYLSMELAGYTKDDIKIEHENGYLTISAQKNETREKKNEAGKIIHQERSYGSCKRSFYIGDAVKREEIKASYRDGILELNFPSVFEQPAIEQKTIEIE